MSALPTPSISVVLCAYNPRPHHLQATLESLRRQDLPLDRWELIFVDNNSQPPLAAHNDLTWHPRARLVVEPKQGLAHARCRGYRESLGALLVHSDDDNVLAPDYLSQAWNIYQTHPHLGTYGGQWIPRFEREPRTHLERSFGGERLVPRDVWSNILDDPRTMPWGAGMCLRQEVVQAYLGQVTHDPRRLILGRTGNHFITGEDIDLNYVAVREGYATGLFHNLSLIHLIPPERMSESHIIRYRAGNAYSMVILWFLHTGELAVPRRSQVGWLMFWLRVWLRMTPHHRRLELAMHRARCNAVKDLHAWGWVK
jgi:glycosyltransferase involved in cell wall biosynthesis